jgi:hypothetical protein
MRPPQGAAVSWFPFPLDASLGDGLPAQAMGSLDAAAGGYFVENNTAKRPLLERPANV